VAAWPTKGQVYFARLDGHGETSKPAEIPTPGQSGMRTGVLALSGPDGSTLVAWKKDNQLGWLRRARSNRDGSTRSDEARDRSGGHLLGAGRPRR
jgi:hypothetical protein